MNPRWIIILVAWLLARPSLQAGPGHVRLIEVDGVIGPATAGYISRATKTAADGGAECLVIQLNTPGGLFDSTKDIVQAFYTSRVPVVVYVAPSGANAGSAGCFITLAADVAAMAPNSSIGAAHPVELGGVGSTKTDDVMTKKLENFAVSYIQAIAEKRRRNATWAESAVRESASITAEKALELNVIDLIGRDLPDLLRQLEGRTINDRILHTAGAEVVTLPMLARERVFHALWRPEIMFILMLIAIYGIVGELSSPGAILPGVAGAIALILALYMGAVLPVNTTGVALLLLAVTLFVIDAFAPTHGILTGGGIIAFFLGALFLFEGAGPAFQLSLAMIVPATALTAAFFIFVVGAGLHAQKLPVRVGRETLVGRTAQVLTPLSTAGGKVFVEGEYWNARSDAPVETGRTVEIVAINGLTLTVKPRT